MDQLSTWLDPIVKTLSPVMIVLIFVIKALPYNAFDRLMIAKHRAVVYVSIQLLVLYAFFQTFNVWLAYQQLSYVQDLLPVLRLMAAGLLLILLIFWVDYWIRKQKHTLIAVFIHYIAIFPIYLISIYYYSMDLTSSDVRTLDYLISLPSIIVFPLLLSLILYIKRKVYVRSYGKVVTPPPNLKVLYSLDKHRRVLLDIEDPSNHYIHYLDTDHYYRYEIVEDKHNRIRKSRRRPVRSDLPALEVAAAEEPELPSRRHRAKRRGNQ